MENGASAVTVMVVPEYALYDPVMLVRVAFTVYLYIPHAGTVVLYVQGVSCIEPGGQ